MKVRVLAAVALLPLLLLVVLVAPKFCTAILFGAMASIGAFELLSGTGILKHPRICTYCAVMAFWCVLWCGLGIGYAWLLLSVLVFWCVLFAEIMASGMKLPFEKAAACLVAGLVLPVLLGALVRIHATEHGRFFILIPFVLAFLSDTGAYFAGLTFGNHFFSFGGKVASNASTAADIPDLSTEDFKARWEKIYAIIAEQRKI